MTTAIRVRTDYENNAECFWDSIRTQVETITDPRLQSQVRQLIRENEVEIGDGAQEFLDFVEAIPGYDDGPSHAKYAVTIQPA